MYCTIIRNYKILYSVTYDIILRIAMRLKITVSKANYILEDKRRLC